MSLPASKRFVSINCNNYVKVSKIDDISVNSTVHDDCPLKRINIGIVKAPITVSLPNLKKGQLLCSSDFLKPLLVHIALTHTKGLLLYLELGCSYIEFTPGTRASENRGSSKRFCQSISLSTSWYLDLAPPPGREVPETQHWISQRTKIRRLPPNQIRPFLFLPADHLLQFNLIEAFHRLLIEFGVKVAVSFLKVLAPILWNYCLPANLLPIRG